MSNMVPIVICFDRNYIMPAAVTAISVMENSNDDTLYEFSFFIPGSDESVCRSPVFQAMKEKYHNFSYRFICIPSDVFEGYEYVANNSWGPMTYARLLIAELLQDRDFCLYLDCDLYTRKDVAGLYAATVADEAFSSCYLAAGEDTVLQKGIGSFFNEHRRILGTGDMTGYFQAGVLIMNLALIRQDRLIDRFKEYFDVPFMMVDQDILNIVCKGKVCFLPSVWNVTTCDIHTGRINLGDAPVCRREEEENAIIHFAGADKPWKVIETKWEIEWFRYACSLPSCVEKDQYLSRLPGPEDEPKGNNAADRLIHAEHCILFGFTEIAKSVFDLLTARTNCVPEAFCDSNTEKNGKAYKGCPCVAPDILSQIMEDSLLIILCTQKSWREVFRMLTGEYGISPERIIRFRLRDSRFIEYSGEKV